MGSCEAADGLLIGSTAACSLLLSHLHASRNVNAPVSFLPEAAGVQHQGSCNGEAAGQHARQVALTSAKLHINGLLAVLGSYALSASFSKEQKHPMQLHHVQHIQVG